MDLLRKDKSGVPDNARTSLTTESRRGFISKLATASAAMAVGGFTTNSFAQETEKVQVLENGFFNGKVVLITGAGRGIGRASAVEFARNGAKLSLLDIADANAMYSSLNYPLASREDLSTTESLVKREGAECISLVADVRDMQQVQSAVTQTLNSFGKIDIVIACAGVGIAKDKFNNYDAGTWKAVMDVNMYGVANTVYAALESLKRANDGGRIVIVSSRAGRIGTGLPAYGSSKWAVTGLMKNLAIELGPFNIRVNCVAPGTADTDLPFYQNELSRNEEGRRQLTKNQNDTAILPTGLIQPEDLAKVILEASGPAVHLTTGATFDANGGSTARTSS